MFLRILLFSGFIFIVALIGYGANRLGHYIFRDAYGDSDLDHFSAIFLGLLAIFSCLGVLGIVVGIVLGCWDLAGRILG